MTHQLSQATGFDRIVNFDLKEMRIGVRTAKDKVSGNTAFKFYQRTRLKSGNETVEEFTPGAERIQEIGREVFLLKKEKKDSGKTKKNIGDKIKSGFKAIGRRLSVTKKEKDPLQELFAKVTTNFQSHLSKETLDELPRQLGDWFHNAAGNIKDVSDKKKTFIYAVALVRFLALFPPTSNGANNETQTVLKVIKHWFVTNKQLWGSHGLCSTVQRFLTAYQPKPSDSSSNDTEDTSSGESKDSPSPPSQVVEHGIVQVRDFSSLVLKDDSLPPRSQQSRTPLLPTQATQPPLPALPALPPLPQIPQGNNQIHDDSGAFSEMPQTSKSSGNHTPIKQNGLSSSPPYSSGLTISPFQSGGSNKTGGDNYVVFNSEQKSDAPSDFTPNSAPSQGGFYFPIPTKK